MDETLAVTDPNGRDPASVLVGLLALASLIFIVGFLGGNLAALYWIFRTVGFGGFLVIGPLLGVADLFIVGGFFSVIVRVSKSVDAMRRRHRYVITEDDYDDAPIAIQATMSNIVKSANSLRTSRSYRDGMFGDLDVDQVLYSAAQHALQANAINVTLRKLKADAGPADQDALRRARVALRKIGRQLDRLDDQLGDAAENAKILSKKLVAAERARESARRQELAAERTRETRNRLRAQLEDSTAQANAKTKIDAEAIAERVAAVSSGYDEAREVSDAVLGAPNHDEPEPPPSVAQAAWNTIRAAVGWITRS